MKLNVGLYYSVDNMGNEESINGPFALKVDTTVPDKQFHSLVGVAGSFIVFILNFALVRDKISGLDKVEFYLNDEFHHQMSLSGWPVGLWRPVFWMYYNPGVGDKCSGIVYDVAGNWEQMKPQIFSVPHFRNSINKQR